MPHASIRRDPWVCGSGNRFEHGPLRLAESAPASPPRIMLAADATQRGLGRYEARWADEPIPALDGQTPRHAILTPVGLERAKGPFRGDERGKADMSARDGRRAVSHRFSWESMGIAA